MQASAVLIVLCTSAYWVLMNSQPIPTVEPKTTDLIKQTLDMFNETTLPSAEVKVPDNDEDECFGRNMEFYIEATQSIFRDVDKVQKVKGNLKEIKKRFLTNCISKMHGCRNIIVPMEDFQNRLQHFLEKTKRCLPLREEAVTERTFFYQ